MVLLTQVSTQTTRPRNPACTRGAATDDDHWGRPSAAGQRKKGRSRLLAKAQAGDQHPIAIDVRLIEVGKLTPALADELEQPASRMMVVLMCAQVLGELRNARGEDGNLNLRGAGVARMRGVLGDDQVGGVGGVPLGGERVLDVREPDTGLVYLGLGEARLAAVREPHVEVPGVEAEQGQPCQDLAGQDGGGEERDREQGVAEFADDTQGAGAADAVVGKGLLDGGVLHR